jgi:hypothetical protein
MLSASSYANDAFSAVTLYVQVLRYSGTGTCMPKLHL